VPRGRCGCATLLGCRRSTTSRSSAAGSSPRPSPGSRRRDGSPRLVPITFALLGELLCFAVDEVKPKRDARLARLDDIARDPRVTLLVDHYDADWSALWWVRIDGTAAVHGTPHTDGTLHTDGTPHTDGALRERALDELAAKYPPYRAARPAGPVVIVTPRRWSGWSAR
jgi:PPOX class probable F420-dependent enzyme